MIQHIVVWDQKNITY